MDGQFDLVVVGSALLTLRPRGPGLAWGDGPIASGSAAVQLGVAILSPPRDIPNWPHRGSLEPRGGR
jgi:hypothetical protein